MKTHEFLPASSPATSRKNRRSLLALALAACVLPLTAIPLHAQQAPPPPPDPTYNQPQAAPPQGYPQQDPNYEQQPGYPQQQDDQVPPPPDDPNYQAQNYPQQGDSQPGDPQQVGQPQALAPDQLAQLVAPVALYPDALLAQVLAASTFPEQVIDASRWSASMGGAPPDQIAQEADAQPWDPSVKGLTAFPQVLQQLAQNLSWTTELGNAYYNQPQDVMNAVQSMRERAEASGTLRTSPQETVDDDQGYIALAPANPEVVYVPEYNPWMAYGAPIAPYPGYSAWDGVGSFIGEGLQFGMGIAMSGFMHMGWGFPMWGLNWIGDALLFHGGGYYSHGMMVADWGLPHGGARFFGGRGGYGDRGYGGGYGNRGFGDRAGYGRGYEGRPGGYAGNRGGYGNGYREGGFHEYGAGPARLNAERAQEGRGGYAGGGYARGGYGGGRYSGGEYAGNRGRMPQAYNRAPQSLNRGYSAAGRGYGNMNASGRTSGYGQNYARPQTIARNEGAMGYGRSQGMSGYRGEVPNARGLGGSYRAPAQSFRGGGQAFRGSGFENRGFAGGSSRGFGGSAPRSFSQPRSFSAPRSFGGRAVERTWRRRQSFRRRRHSGGGGHFGGGHSGGGHGGGGHRR